MNLGSSILLAALLVGCGKPYYTTTMRTGGLFPTRGDQCAIEFLNVPAASVANDYTILGQVLLSGASSAEFTPEMKEDIRINACKMGGEAVVLSAAADNTQNYGGGAAFGYMVLKKK